VHGAEVRDEALFPQHGPGKKGRYEYLSYGFANYPADILDLVESTCRAQGLRPRRYARAIRLNRRDDVARLLEHVSLKS
jgi:hypothetical protein